MSYIYCKMFGNFYATVDKKEILFPYSKIQALFCYLLINKHDTREHLANLLWTDEEEGVAKKNLRNAVYKIRKCFGIPVLISPQKSVILLNPDVKIETDVNKFLVDENETDIYDGEFLQGFCPKNAANFEKWMMDTKENFENMYIARLNKKIEKELKEGSYEDVERYSKLLIKADEFNESAYAYLLESYKNQGKYNIAIQTYNDVKKLFQNELSITPNEKILKIFNEILDIVNKKANTEKPEEFFYGRYNELRILQGNYDNFINNENAKSIILIGEAGVGKTRLKDKFLEMVERKETYVIEADCFQFEKDCILKSWEVILSKLSDIIKNDDIKIPAVWTKVISSCFPEFSKLDSDEVNAKITESTTILKYEVVGNTIIEILKKISCKKKIVLIFEDIQWIDDLSLTFLSSIVLHENNNIMCFITYRNEYNTSIDKFIVSANKYNKILKINLVRFNNDEVESFIKTGLPKIKFTKAMINKIYNETEGNAFFLTEYLNAIKYNSDINIMSAKMQDIMKSRFLDVSEEGKNLLRISSLFFDEVPLEILHEITGKDELEIMDIIEELENKFLLKEINSKNKISFKFTHQKLREFVYMSQSQARRRIFHNRIACILEKSLKNNRSDVDTYHKLIYHFSNAGNNISTLKYSIKSLNVYLNFSHELYPILYYNDVDSYNNFYFSSGRTVKSLKKIEHLLLKVKNEYKNSEEASKLEIEFLHMKGRYLIREGEYEKGIELINEMMEKSGEIKDADYSIEGYKQMVYYCIQTYNTEDMIKYINLGLDKAADCNYHKEIGIFLRFKGLYKKMQGEYDEAERILNESIDIFNVTKKVADKYALSIAAAYNYIGDIRRQTMHFSEALEYFNKAIKICEDKNVFTSLAIFNINAGETCFNMENYAESKKYFQKALHIYKQFDLIWEKSIVEAFMSSIAINEENYDEALEFLKNSDLHSNSLKSPHEIGIAYMIKTQIKIQMKNNKKLDMVFNKYLTRDTEWYCNEGIKYLTKSRDNYEVNFLKSLKIY